MSKRGSGLAASDRHPLYVPKWLYEELEAIASKTGKPLWKVTVEHLEKVLGKHENS